MLKAKWRAALINCLDPFIIMIIMIIIVISLFIVYDGSNSQENFKFCFGESHGGRYKASTMEERCQANRRERSDQVYWF